MRRLLRRRRQPNPPPRERGEEEGAKNDGSSTQNTNNGNVVVVDEGHAVDYDNETTTSKDDRDHVDNKMRSPRRAVGIRRNGCRLRHDHTQMKI